MDYGFSMVEKSGAIVRFEMALYSVEFKNCHDQGHCSTGDDFVSISDLI